MRSVEIDARQGKNALAGEQKKFYINGVWFKVDSVRGQGIVEYLSRLVIQFSNIAYKVPDYVPVIINGKTGCASHDISNGSRMITLSSLYLGYTGRGLERDIYVLPDVFTRMQFTVKFLCETVGMDYKSVICFFGTMFQLDALLINSDRHLNNIEFKQTPSGYEPILIDFGRSLFCISEEVVQLKSIDIDKAILALEPKPFGSFDEQYSLFKPSIKIDYVGLLAKLENLHEIPFFFKHVLMYQLRKYRNEFSSVVLARLTYEGRQIGYRAISLSKVYDFKADCNLPCQGEIPTVYDGNEYHTMDECGMRVNEISLSKTALGVLFQ